MKNTKKYKFVGDSSGWGWDSNPVKGVVYDEGMLGKMYGGGWEGRRETIMKSLMLLGDWEEVTDEPSVIEKLSKLDKIFDELLSCTGEIWEEIKEGDPNIRVGDQKEVLRLISSITFKYDQLNKEFNS